MSICVVHPLDSTSLFSTPFSRAAIYPRKENGLFFAAVPTYPMPTAPQCPPHHKNLWRPRTPAPSRQSVGTYVQSPYMHTYLPIYRGSPRQPGPKEHGTLISADRPQQQGQQQQQQQKQGTRPPHIQSCDKITPAVPGRVVWFVYAMHRRIGVYPPSATSALSGPASGSFARPISSVPHQRSPVS